MISRIYIKCDTCDYSIILRVVMGANEHPRYSFRCPSCDEVIEMGLNISFEKVSGEYLFIENCSSIESNEEGHVINLSAEIPIDLDSRHEDGYSAFLSVDRSLFGIKDVGYNVIQRVHRNWKHLRRSSSQMVKGKKNLVKRYCEKYQSLSDKDQDKDVFSQLHDFLSFFLFPKRNLYIESVLESIKLDRKKYKNEYLRFFNYFIENIFEKNFRRVLDMIDIYMKNFESLYPILMYLRSEEEISENISTSSFSFDSLKMFYGNIFEINSSLFEVLAIINNIHEGRNYDEFKSMNLKKYKTIDKAKRADPFKDNIELYHFAKEFNSSIRNASHHVNLELDTKDKLKYYHGKNLNGKEMTVREYIIMCNEIYINMISIFDILLHLNEFTGSSLGKSAYR